MAQLEQNNIDYKQKTDEQLINIIDYIDSMECDKNSHSIILDIIKKVRKECSKELQSRYIGEEYLRFLSYNNQKGKGV